MAISWIANAVHSTSPTADTTITLPTGSMAVGDLIVIAFQVADTTNNAISAPTEGGYTNVIGATIYADDVNDINFDIFYKYWNGTDTTATFTDVGGSNASNVAVCMIFRDVAPVANGGPFSTAAVQASGVSSSTADPAQIATEANCAVVIAGGTSHTGGATATFTNPTNYTTNPGVRAHNDTIDGLVGMGYRLSGYANPENPGSFSPATIGTAADNAWAAVTMALRAYYASIACAAPTALATVKFAPTVTRATERFTHADAANDLTAEKTWTTWSGSNFGIVSNQAKMSGIRSAICRMEVDADLSALVTLEATLVTFTGGNGSTYASMNLYLQKDSSSTNTLYGFAVRRDASEAYFMYKMINGAFTQLGASVVEAFPSLPLLVSMTWNPATNTIKGYINGVEKISQVDSAITANTRGGIAADSLDSNFVCVVDNVYLSGLSANTTVSGAAPTALVTAKFAPTVTTPQRVTGAAPTALTLTTFAPTVSTPQRVTGATPTALILTTFAPTVTAIGTASVVGAAPTALTLTTFAPTVSIGTRVTGAAPTALTLTPFEPTVRTPRVVTPDTLNVFLTTFAPTVTAAAGLLITPATLGLTLTTYPPDVTAVGAVTAMPIGTVPVRYLIGMIANVVPVVTVLLNEAGVVPVREFVGPENVVPVREVTTEVPHVKVLKV